MGQMVIREKNTYYSERRMFMKANLKKIIIATSAAAVGIAGAVVVKRNLGKKVVEETIEEVTK